MTFDVKYSSKQAPLLSAVVAKFLGIVVKFSTVKGNDAAPVLNDSEAGFAVAGDFAIARYLARAAGKPELLGADSIACSEVDQFLDFFLTTFIADPAAAALSLDSALTHRTFLAGFSLTLADIAAGVFLTEHAGIVGGLSATARYMALISSKVPLSAVSSLKRTVADAPAAAAGAGKAAKGGKKGGDAAAKGGKAAKGGDVAAKGGKGGAAAAAGGGNKGGKGKGPKVSKSGKPKKDKPIVVNKHVTLPALPGAVEGKVCTRFPPEPSGYLHVGHIKAAMLNAFYAQHYKGELLLRFDDTNPRKEKVEYEEAIIEDLSKLGIVPNRVSHTSDFFPVILEYALKMLSEGNAYMDDSTSEEMFQQRAEGLPSPHREDAVADNLARFELMLNAKEEGRPWCMRAKLDFEAKNKCLRDPVMFRHVEEPHNRTGTKYMAYPTYDFACPIVDAIEGVSHAMRTTEYRDRDEQYAWIGRLLGVREVCVVEFARMNFQFTALSKRKLAELADNGFVSGWDDPRFPTVRAVMRRGITLEALREFILSQGASKRITDMEWDKFWATNKKVIDKVCPRYTAVSAEAKTLLTLSGEGCPAEGVPEFRTAALHPKNKEVGTKSVPFASRVWLETDDVALLSVGEEVTLMKWGNAVVTAIAKEGDVITGVSATLKPDGDVRATEKKLTWVSDVAGLVPIVIREFDVLITKARLEEGDDIKAVFNQNSIADTRGIAEPALANVGVGDILQLERRGYCRVDAVPGVGADGVMQPLVLFNIPSGKEKSMSTLSSKITRTDHATLDERRAAATADRIAKTKKSDK